MRLNVREWSDTETPVLTTLSIGQEVAVYGTAVVYAEEARNEDETDFFFFFFCAYVTDSKEEADRLIAEEQARQEAARAAAEAQARAEEQARAAAAAQAQAQAAAQQQANAVQEVRREKVPGCDDPNHGMIYITYSDGSVVVEEY